MKYFRRIIFLLTTLAWLGCDDEVLLPSTDDMQSQVALKNNDKTKASIVTGDVNVEFYANKHGNHETSITENDGLEEELKYAQVVFNAHEPSKNKDAMGTLEIIMKDPEGLIKRSFLANVFAVLVYPDDNEARFLAKVISDIKTDHSGEEHDDEGTDGGNHTGGNSSGGNHTDGDHTDGDHTDGDHTDGGPGEEGNSGGTHGNQSRVDQIIAVSAYDGGSPGTNGDVIHWRWFGGNNPNTPAIDGQSGWGNLCDKEIVGGNLVVHVK